MTPKLSLFSDSKGAVRQVYIGRATGRYFFALLAESSPFGVPVYTHTSEATYTSNASAWNAARRFVGAI